MENKIEIRGYQEKDKEEVQNICVVTANEFLQQPDKRFMLLNAYCNYYIEQEPDNCFVAVDSECDKVVGYIISVENSDAWAKKYKELYVDNCEVEELKEFFMNTTSTALKYSKEFPSHLHIDILPEYQRRGIGFMLMDKLVSNLRNKNIFAVMLSAGADNEKGINFYKKYGFEVLRLTEHECAMGLKF